MTSQKYNWITNELAITQALMVGLGMREIDIYKNVLTNNPSQYDEDESYFESVIDGLIELCETEEYYEVCEELQRLKEGIRC